MKENEKKTDYLSEDGYMSRKQQLKAGKKRIN